MRTLKPRQFTYFFIITIGLFVVFHALTWHFAVSQLLQPQQNAVVTGDLARLGYITDLKHPRKNYIDVPKKHLETSDFNGQKIDLLTLGDSFSNGGAKGPNPYYQDFMASEWGWEILNLRGVPELRNDIDLVNALLQANLLQEWGVRYVLLQATQRKIISRYADTPTPRHLPSREALLDHYQFGQPRPHHSPTALPDVSWINDGNVKYWWNKIMYHIDDCAFTSKTCRTRLSERRFSIADGKDVLFYRKSLSSLSRNTADAVERMNARLDTLAQKLHEQNIHLIVMPAVTKYALYQPDMINQNYPPDPLLSHWRKMPHQFTLIDTQAILRQAITSGDLDIFYVDDTHWTPKASRHITQALGKQLQLNQ